MGVDIEFYNECKLRFTMSASCVFLEQKGPGLKWVSSWVMHSILQVCHTQFSKRGYCTLNSLGVVVVHSNL